MNENELWLGIMSHPAHLQTPQKNAKGLVQFQTKNGKLFWNWPQKCDGWWKNSKKIMPFKKNSSDFFCFCLQNTHTQPHKQKQRLLFLFLAPALRHNFSFVGIPRQPKMTKHFWIGADFKTIKCKCRQEFPHLSKVACHFCWWNILVCWCFWMMEWPNLAIFLG